MSVNYGVIQVPVEVRWVKAQAETRENWPTTNFGRHLPSCRVWVSTRRETKVLEIFLRPTCPALTLGQNSRDFSAFFVWGHFHPKFLGHVINTWTTHFLEEFWPSKHWRSGEELKRSNLLLSITIWFNTEVRINWQL